LHQTRTLGGLNNSRNTSRYSSDRARKVDGPLGDAGPARFFPSGLRGWHGLRRLLSIDAVHFTARRILAMTSPSNRRRRRNPQRSPSGKPLNVEGILAFHRWPQRQGWSAISAAAASRLRKSCRRRSWSFFPDSQDARTPEPPGNAQKRAADLIEAAKFDRRWRWDGMTRRP
jgi:hypothetical protein